jgi:hypothetical protein
VSAQTQDTLAERQATLPELVTTFREFLRLAVQSRRQVVIGIDEMDKMESGEAAQDFLNAIKMIFGLDGVFFVVSISESAMSRFDRRGLPFRDVFDSSFDDVIPVEPLTLARSKRLLRSRVIAMAAPYMDLCHCLSGGLPRDLLRVVRQLSLLNHRRKALPQVCRRLVAMDLARKLQAATVTVQGCDHDPGARELFSWMEELRHQPPDVDALEQHCVKLPDGWPADEAEGDDDVATLRRIHLELAAYTYFLATVLKLFTEDEGGSESWFTAAEHGREGHTRLDRLGRARVAFSVNPHVAVAIVNEFRRLQWPQQPLPWKPAQAPRARLKALVSHARQHPYDAETGDAGDR